MESTDNQFRGRVRETCAKAIKSAGSLEEALQACKGLFPADAISEFLRINPQRTQDLLADRSMECSRSSEATKEGVSFVLSTWEYDESCIANLLSLIGAKESRVCLMGCPTLARYLDAESSIDTKLLIDLRTPIEATHGSICYLKHDIHTLSGREFSRAFDVCVIDPPWYVESYLRWIDVAVRYLRHRGSIAFSLLGSLTRPSALQDRQIILAHCEQLGLSVDVHEDAILYGVPEFEQAILRRAGIPIVPWKRADLVIAKKVSATEPSCLSPIPAVPPFYHFKLPNLTIDLILDRYDEGGALLIKSGAYWMKSPSRRERGLADCNIFTSNGARFTSQRPLDLCAILANLEHMNSEAVRYRLVELGFPQDVIEDAFRARRQPVRLSS